MIKHILTLIWNKKGSNTLLMIEILLAFLVLFAVLSFVFFNMDRLSEPLGFETENRKYIRYGNLDHIEGDSIRNLAVRELKRSLQDLELVESVSLSHDVSPFAGSNWCSGSDDMGFNIEACYSVVDYDFVKTNGMKIVAGRDFKEEDMAATYPVLLANKTFMDDTFGDKDMIDSIIGYNGAKRQIIGVVEEYKYDGEFAESQNRILLLSTSKNSSWARLTNAYIKLDPSADVAYEEKISKIVQSVVKTTNFVIQDAPLLRKRANLDTWIPMIALLSICAFLCLNVALGLFGVLSYSISQRKAEVGLRRAMGAHAGSIIQQFTMEVVILAGMAVLIGVIFAIQIPLLNVMDVENSIFFRGILYATIIILVVVTLCALYPSIQASRIHPATALHED
ncbi:MAG: FtsX-like permease family protein [Saprospiraceae bacterium]